MFAVFVVLVLALGGLLLWRGAFARPAVATEARAPGAERLVAAAPARRRKTSRGAPVRSFKFYASRAPGLLCERAFGFVSRRARGRVLRPARAFARAPEAARFAPALC